MDHLVLGSIVFIFIQKVNVVAAGNIINLKLFACHPFVQVPDSAGVLPLRFGGDPRDKLFNIYFAENFTEDFEIDPIVFQCKLKMVELDIQGIKRFTAKFSEDKVSFPGAKQLFRFEGHDILARSGECSNGQAMLRPVLLGGKLVEPLPDLNAARNRAAALLAKLPASLHSLDPAEPWPVRHSKDLAALIERTRSNLV